MKLAGQAFIDEAWPYVVLTWRADPIAVRKNVHGYDPSPHWVTRRGVVTKG